MPFNLPCGCLRVRVLQSPIIVGLQVIELLYGYNPSLISLQYDFFPFLPLLQCTQFNFSAFRLFGFMEAFGTFPSWQAMYGMQHLF